MRPGRAGGGSICATIDLSAAQIPFALLLGPGSERRSASQPTNRPYIGGINLPRLFTEIGPFAAFAEATLQATEELRSLAVDGPVVLFTPTEVAPIKGLEVQLQAPLRQMIFADVPETFKAAFDPLGAADVPAMLELTALTKPGPFSARTYELGRYIGIREDNRLVAMARERMRFGGFTEISAVCLHPDHRGKGCAQRLIRALINGIADRGETPFLHVFVSNLNAIALYERLEFAVHATLQVTVLQRGATFGSGE